MSLDTAKIRDELLKLTFVNEGIKIKSFPRDSTGKEKKLKHDTTVIIFDKLWIKIVETPFKFQSQADPETGILIYHHVSGIDNEGEWHFSGSYETFDGLVGTSGTLIRRYVLKKFLAK